MKVLILKRKSPAFLSQLCIFIFCVFICAFSSATSLSTLSLNTGLLSVLGSDQVPLVSARYNYLEKNLLDYLQKNDVSVVALQEIWNLEGHALPLKRKLEKLGYKVYVPFIDGLEPTQSYSNFRRPFSSGLLLAVKNFDVRSVDFELFEQNDVYQSRAKKGILAAHLLGPHHETITIFNVHTNNLHDGTHGAPDPARLIIHKAQLMQLKAKVFAQRVNGDALLIAGDFNSASATNSPGFGNENHELFGSQMQLQDSYETIHPGGRDCSWCSSNNSLVKQGDFPNSADALIDNFFFSGTPDLLFQVSDFKIVFQEFIPNLLLNSQSVPVSDHYGIQAQFELNPLHP